MQHRVGSWFAPVFSRILPPGQNFTGETPLAFSFCLTFTAPMHEITHQLALRVAPALALPNLDGYHTSSRGFPGSCTVRPLFTGSIPHKQQSLPPLSSVI